MADGFVKDDANKPRFSLMEPYVLMQDIAVLEFGAKKYEKDNWRGPGSLLRFYDAVFRHLIAWLLGQDTDPESGLPHLAHARVGLMFIMAHQEYQYSEDDRYNYKGRSVPKPKKPRRFFKRRR